MSGMEASKYDINADMAVEYHCDRRGTAVSHDAICGAVSCGVVPEELKKECDFRLTKGLKDVVDRFEGRRGTYAERMEDYWNVK